MCPFFDFQYGFRSSRSTADFLTVVSDRIARVFNRSGAFDRVWRAGLLHKLKSNLRISGHVFQILFLLFSEIDGFEWFWMEFLKRISSQC